MGNTLSMSHPPVFVSEPNLTPSDKKLGRATLYVHLSLVPSDSYAERAKGAKGVKEAKGGFQLKKASQTPNFSVFSFHFSVKKSVADT